MVDKMTPQEIVYREILKIPAMRIPLANVVVARIFDAFEEYGYAVTDAQLRDIKSMKGK